MRSRAALFWSWRGLVRAGGSRSLRYARSGLIYLSVVGMLVLVVGLSVHRVVETVLAQFVIADAPRPAPVAKVAARTLPPALPMLASPKVVREVSMSLMAGRGDRDIGRADRRVPVREFGTSRRNGSFFRPFGDDPEEDEERKSQPTFRTMCVRMCDGYYFPISYATTQERFAKDALACHSKCGGAARLFVHRNPGETLEQMVDLQGRRYAQLPTAFLYRTQFVAACKCQPDPWDAEAKERHRVYALAESARKGNVQAQVELKALEKMRRDAQNKVATLNGAQPLPGDGPLHPAPVLDGEQPMGMGNSPTPRPQAPSAKGGLPDWARRVFSNY